MVQVAAVFLIAVGSGLILTLAGVLKDIVSRPAVTRPNFPLVQGILTPPSADSPQLLISGSVLAFGSSITMIQVFGYTVALSGLVLFKTGGAKK